MSEVQKKTLKFDLTLDQVKQILLEEYGETTDSPRVINKYFLRNSKFITRRGFPRLRGEMGIRYKRRIKKVKSEGVTVGIRKPQKNG